MAAPIGEAFDAKYRRGLNEEIRIIKSLIYPGMEFTEKRWSENGQRLEQKPMTVVGIYPNFVRARYDAPFGSYCVCYPYDVFQLFLN